MSLSPLTTLKADLSASFLDSLYLLPINLLIEAIVLVGLVTACLLAGSPTLISPPSTNAMTEGVVLFPSALGITTGSLPSITETHEFVVPKSIPIILFIFLNLSLTFLHISMIMPSLNY